MKHVVSALLVTLLALSPLGTAIPVEARARTKIVVGMPGGNAAHAPEIVRRFEELNPDVQVEPLVLPWGQFFDRLILMLVSGVAPDVWYGEAGRALGWYQNGFTADLKPFVDRDLELDRYFFLHAAEDPKSGAWTGIPSDFQVTSLFYNTEHFRSNGIGEPDERWTTEDLIATARKLTVPGSADVETQRWGFALQPEYITAGWMLWMKMMGGEILDETRSDSRLLGTANRRALEGMQSLMHDQAVAPAPGWFGFAPWEAVRSFQEGRTSMMFNIYAYNQTFAQAGFEDYDVAVVPMGPSGRRFTTAVPNVWVMNENSTEAKKDAAWRWIAFQVEEDAQRLRMATGSGVPVNRGVAFDFQYLPGAPDNRYVYIDSYAFADTLEENAVWEQYRQAIEAELLPVWERRVTPEAALSNAHQRVMRILQEASESS